ncbi:hypothetical protein EDD22DRAFT_848073 [Suillus occidentalis]|nr:hypothetical protein EDD22DRAFT_848073 [Suillus occidentalis]
MDMSSELSASWFSIYVEVGDVKMNLNIYSFKQIQNLLDSFQTQECTTLNYISAKDLTLQKLICKCQTNTANSQYIFLIFIIDNIWLAFHLAVYALGYSTMGCLLIYVKERFFILLQCGPKKTGLQSMWLV